MASCLSRDTFLFSAFRAFGGSVYLLFVWVFFTFLFLSLSNPSRLPRAKSLSPFTNNFFLRLNLTFCPWLQPFSLPLPSAQKDVEPAAVDRPLHSEIASSFSFSPFYTSPSASWSGYLLIQLSRCLPALECSFLQTLPSPQRTSSASILSAPPRQAVLWQRSDSKSSPSSWQTEKAGFTNALQKKNVVFYRSKKGLEKQIITCKTMGSAPGGLES